MKVHDTSVYLNFRLLGDGRIIGVMALLLDQGQIVMGQADKLWYTDVWMYARTTQALAAFEHWDGAVGTEPEGWTRHTPSYRRREYDAEGHLTTEEVRE